MKVLSLFSGIGAFEKSLERLGVECKLVGFSEIDKYAVKSYCAIHNVDESLNLGDITHIDEKALQQDIDLITYGFPCQDISLAGKQKGLLNEDGTKTRSGLFFEALRIIEEIQPKIAIAENVKNLTSKKFNAQFQVVLASLDAAGYNNYWTVLNAKDFGIPQNRERVFIVSIRKDIDTGRFKFPEGFPLELRLKDILEDEVDEKYYLGEKGLNLVKKHQETRVNRTTKDADLTLVQLGHGFNPGCEMDADIFPTLTIGSAMHWHTLICEKDGKILVREATKKGYTEAVEGDSINLEQPNSKTRRGRVGKQVAQTLTTSPQQAVVELPAALDEQNQYIRKDGCVGTLTTDGSSPKHNNRVIQTDLRIRKLTPKECWRLMDFDDEDFEKAEAVNSNTQLYKQAGNSIVVAVSTAIIKALIEANIFIEKEENEMELKVIQPTFPEIIEFNFDELKEEITKKASDYMNLVYSEDQIQDAKKDVATLRKFTKALSDERIKVKKECLKPYEDFEAKIKELAGIVDKAILNIDGQVKAVDEKKKAEKQMAIEAYFEGRNVFDWLKLEQIFSEKWLNASVNMKTVCAEIDTRLEQITKDLETLSNLPEFGFEATEEYKWSLDINKAIAEGHRLSEIQKRKAEEVAKTEKAAIQPTPNTEAEESPRMWISFKALLSTEDAIALKDFFNSRNIEFEAI